MTTPEPTRPAPDSADFTRRCTDCMHLTRRGTCTEPESAGLIPVGAGFGLAWPGLLHAATCPTFTLKPAR